MASTLGAANRRDWCQKSDEMWLSWFFWFFGDLLQQPAEVSQILFGLELPANFAGQGCDFFWYFDLAHIPSPLQLRVLVYEQLHNLIYSLMSGYVGLCRARYLILLR
jgi:hypothetical protein